MSKGGYDGGGATDANGDRNQRVHRDAASNTNENHGSNHHGSNGGNRNMRLEQPLSNAFTDEIEHSRQPSYLAAVGCASNKSMNCSDNRNKVRPPTAPRVRKVDIRTPTVESRSNPHDNVGVRQSNSKHNTLDNSPDKSTPAPPRLPHVGQRKADNGVGVKLRAGQGVRASVDLSQWIQDSAEEDEFNGQYINPRVVENVIRCRQMMTTGVGAAKNVARLSKANAYAQSSDVGSHCGRHSLDEDIYPVSTECTLKLDAIDIDRDSGISGDRNSASSTSSGRSVESSLTSLNSADDYPTSDRASCSSSTMSCSSSLEHLDYSANWKMLRSNGWSKRGAVAVEVPSPSLINVARAVADYRPNTSSATAHECPTKRGSKQIAGRDSNRRPTSAVESNVPVTAGITKSLFCIVFLEFIGCIVPVSSSTFFIQYTA